MKHNYQITLERLYHTQQSSIAFNLQCSSFLFPQTILKLNWPSKNTPLLLTFRHSVLFLMSWIHLGLTGKYPSKQSFTILLIIKSSFCLSLISQSALNLTWKISIHVLHALFVSTIISIFSKTCTRVIHRISLDDKKMVICKEKTNIKFIQNHHGPSFRDTI